MKLKKSFQLAVNIFVHSKLRSWLTIIGIVVGIAAVVGIVSMSLGAQQQIEQRLGSLGADVLTISPGAQRAFGGGFGGDGPRGDQITSSSTQKNLTAKDVIVIKSVPNVKYVMGQVSGQADVVYSSKTSSLSIRGVDTSIWKYITTETLSSGRFLDGSDAYSVVIGDNVANSVFGKEIPLNTKISIEGVSFNVVGIISGGRAIYMPLSQARVAIDKAGSTDLGSISVKIVDVTLSNETITAITKKLMMSRGILQASKADFSVSNPAAMQQTIQSTLSTLTFFLAAIAAVSLFVGGIGIANTMFTSVLEKTKEIGIMKAIGTQNKDIMAIFLLNSGLIGLVGGIGGVVIGTIASALISSMSGISPTSSTNVRGGGGLSFLTSSSVISFPLIIGALLFAVVIGMVAGAIPAYRASRLNPVDALRYE